MKLKLLRDYNYKYKAGFLCEIDSVMSAPGQCSSGVKLRVVNMSKRPKWFDLGWFVNIKVNERKQG